MYDFKIRSIKQIIFNNYATNLELITQRSLRMSSLLILLSEFNNFSFLIDLIDYIIQASGTPTNGSALLLSRVSVCITQPVYCKHWRSYGHVIQTYLTYIRFGKTLTKFYVFFETETLDRTLICLNQLQRFRFQPIPMFPLQSL